MDTLPREIVLNILSRLPITSLIHVKSVSRSWRSIAQDPLLASMQFSRMSKINDPCLILHFDLPIRNHLYTLHFSYRTNIRTLLTKVHHMPAVISEFDIIGSCNGLLCLWHSLFKDECYIYNPFTGYFIKKLPNPKQFPTQKRIASGFGFDSTTKRYKVVRIVYYKKEEEEENGQLPRFSLPESEIQVLSIGNRNLKWRSTGKTSYQLGMQKQSQVLFKERIHWLTDQYRYQIPRQIVCFDLKDEQFKEIPSPNQRRFGIFCIHVVILRNCLCVVERGCQRLVIWEMKEYGVRESWSKEFVILEDYLPTRLLDDSTILSLPNAKVLCSLKNGEIVLEYKGRFIVSYNPQFRIFEKLSFQCLPECFNVVVHIGGLCWIDTPIDM